MVRLLERVIDRVTGFAAVIGGVFTGIMTLIVGYAVIARYIFNRPIGWSEEISVYLMVWAVFLGAAYTLKEDAHIGVDILISKAPARIRRALLLFHYLVGILFMSILFYHGIDMVALTLKMGSRSLAIDFPLVLSHLAVPVGSGILILQLINKLISLAAGRH
ncbi:MAG: TRAP transporter small permease [Syntrophorhabdaceae bacterium]|nr:TRAP transporter small permease [Syntrophorhabdaceae bacterium]MDD5242920.1 TRAP transporter small permease [Syntrophorhabdaceae bacterium]